MTHPYADDPAYQARKAALPSFEERFSIAPVTKGYLPGSPRELQAAHFDSLGRNYKRKACITEDGEHREWRRFGRSNKGIYRIQCGLCKVTRQCSEAEFLAVKNRMGPKRKVANNGGVLVRLQGGAGGI